MSEDGFESDSDIGFEIVDTTTEKKTVLTIPFRPTHSNRKRLLCFSVSNNETCNYGTNCTYAHSTDEQIIDPERLLMFRIIVDKNLLGFFDEITVDTYKILQGLLFMANLCKGCMMGKCSGGYNCRSGVFDPFLKLCKNDLSTGECMNKIIDIPINERIIKKLTEEDVEPADSYQGCINGQHLTLRGLIPTYKYLHQQESSKGSKHQSTRYIDIDPIARIFKNYTNPVIPLACCNTVETDSTTDEELNDIFKNKPSISSDEEWNGF